eukprot:1469650-Rhodomonas_salina.1
MVLRQVYAGGSTREGGVIVAVVGKVEARRGREGGEEKEEGGGRRGAGEGERGERVCNEEGKALLYGDTRCVLLMCGMLL